MENILEQLHSLDINKKCHEEIMDDIINNFKNFEIKGAPEEVDKTIDEISKGFGKVKITDESVKSKRTASGKSKKIKTVKIAVTDEDIEDILQGIDNLQINSIGNGCNSIKLNHRCGFKFEFVLNCNIDHARVFPEDRPIWIEAF